MKQLMLYQNKRRTKSAGALGVLTNYETKN